VDVDALPAVLPFGIGEEAGHHLRVEVALALEVGVEAAVREPGSGHDPRDRDALEAEAVEEAARAVDDASLHFGVAGGGVGHGAPRERREWIGGSGDPTRTRAHNMTWNMT